MIEDSISRLVVISPIIIATSICILKIADWISNKIIKGDDNE